MVAAVHFYATSTDQLQLLDYLGEPQEVSLLPWPVMSSPTASLARADALTRPHVMVVNPAMGRPSTLRSGDMAMTEPSRAGVFNRLNWERLKPGPTEGLVDSNVSPVLLWTPAAQTENALIAGSIGSQADSMRSISEDYERWVNRVMGWVRRKGVKVWGLETRNVRPDLNIERPDVTTLFALPAALAMLEDGGLAR